MPVVAILRRKLLLLLQTIARTRKVVARVTAGSHTRNNGRINGEEEVAIGIWRSGVVAGIATSDAVGVRVVDEAGRPIAKRLNA